MEKRSFYNQGEFKGLKKEDFYKLVIDFVNGEEISEVEEAFIVGAAEYELESIEIRRAKAAEKSGTGEAKDFLESPYAQSIVATFVPMLTGEPQSAGQLAEAGVKAGIVAESGKPYGAPWIGRVMKRLAADGKVNVQSTKVTKVNAKGLKAEAIVDGYTKA